jgi:peroxin-7
MNQPPASILHTPGFAQYNVAWSPFHTTRIAVVSSANYGIIGNGRLHVASTFQSPSGMASVKLDKL